MRTRFRKTGCFLPVFLLLVATMTAAQERTPTTTARSLTVGFVLSGGGARGIAHIGVLRWCEEHRVPVDYISGTSMGGLIGGLYATGMKPDEMLNFFKGIDWKEVFDVGPSFNQLTYRRREDRRSFQTRFEFGLKDGLSLPNGLGSAHYIGLLIDRMTLPYSTLGSFDELPIPFRCMATDFLKAESVELRDGALGSALRATMAIPGVFPPVEREGRILVDGGLLNNIPTNVMRAELKPDVVIAVDNGTQLGDARTI
ncbi:MAG: patatin-like phospholipase family protein, partial [Acidobacteriota bacterium]